MKETMAKTKTDAHLQRDVLDELDWEPSVDAAQIGVTAKEGVVTLTGHVPVYSEKHTAEEVAKRVHGVRAVANEIEVRPSDVHVRDDEEIAAAAVHALQWDAEVPEERRSDLCRRRLDQGGRHREASVSKGGGGPGASPFPRVSWRGEQHRGRFASGRQRDQGGDRSGVPTQRRAEFKESFRRSRGWIGYHHR